MLMHAVISTPAGRHMIKQTNTPSIRLKSGTARSQFKHSTTVSMSKGGMIRDFGSFHIHVGE